MKLQAHTVAHTVKSILTLALASKRSALLVLSGVTLIDVLGAGPAMATTLTGLTGRSAPAILATQVPARPAPVNSGTTTPGQQPATASASTRNFSAALASIQAQLAAQAAARSAAQGAPSDVPDGLVQGGLQVATGQRWSNAKDPTQSQAAEGHVNVEIEQTDSQAILNWSSFNVGKNTTVHFDQRAGTQADGSNAWVALNRVDDPTGVPSQIRGQIKAEGSVYIVNRNGVVFGGSSQVNVRSLVASSLEITDDQFLAGIVNTTASNNTATPLAPVFANASGTAADVVVEAGAVVQTNPPASVTNGGGTIMLLGGNVSNAGSLLASNGQVLLAAGTSAYLYNSIDSSVRGATVNVLNGGTVTNEASGYIAAPTGNVTLAGIKLHQKGVLAASTSVDEAGSIVMSAGDGLMMARIINDAGLVTFVPQALHTGLVELGAGSLTTILPEQSALTAVDGQPQGQSLIRMDGENVNVLGGAMLFAPGAKVQMVASGDGLTAYATYYPTSAAGLAPTAAADMGRVYVGTGAVIDVAGLKDVSVEAAQDAVQVEVRGNELRDDLAQQGGVLSKQKVWVNIHDLLTIAPDRIYTNGNLLEVSGWLGLTPRTVDERLTKAGSVNIVSTGDVILRPGANIDISGGSVLHKAGYANHTFLLGADGHIYDINNAPAEMQYVSIGMSADSLHSRWNLMDSFTNGFMDGKIYQSGYLEGKAAGELSILSRQIELDANVDASTVYGQYQRLASTLPKNGKLTIGGTMVGGARLLPNNVVIGPAVEPVADPFSDLEPTGLFPADPDYATGPHRARDAAALLPFDLQQTVYLSQDSLNDAQYGAIAINSGTGARDATDTLIPGGFAIAADTRLQLAHGGSLTVNTFGGVKVEGSIVARGGSVTMTTGTGSTAADQTDVDIRLAATGVIDTRGLWVNDYLDPGTQSPLLYDGGNVTLNARGNVFLDEGSLIDASSGGWVHATASLKRAGGLPVGSGGNITLDPGNGRAFPLYSRRNVGGVVTVVNTPQTYPVEAVLGGTLRSYGFTRGGTLSIAERQIVIGGDATSGDGVLALAPSFFAQGGFSRFQLYGYQGVTIAPDTVIDLHATGFLPNEALLGAPTGADFTALTTIGARSSLVPPQAVDLILSATDPFAGDVSVGKGAAIHADLGATVALHAQHSLFFDGTIDAPAGNIYLDLFGAPMPASTSNPGYDATQTLWIGSDARLLARGFIGSYGDSVYGTVTNVFRNGGSVNINTDKLDALYYPDASSRQPLPASIANVQVGYAPLGTVIAEKGAIVDVSGVAGEILVPQSGARGYAPLSLATDGGAVSIFASQGLLWNASIDAHAGGAEASGGSLTIDQIAVPVTNNLAVPFTQPIYELVLSQHAKDPAHGLAPGDAVPESLAGKMFFSVDQIESAGFDNVSLGAVDALVFDGALTLSVADTLRINALNIAATTNSSVTLNAAYADLGAGQRRTDLPGFNLVPSTAAAVNPVAGTAHLTVNADLIDIDGALRSGAAYNYTSGFNMTPVTPMAIMTAVSLEGFASMDFNSSGDIRLVNQTSRNTAGGLLATLGDLNFRADQVYTTTGGEPNSAARFTFTISAKGATSTVTFARNDASTPDVPLSAASILKVIAPSIVQGGVLRAPLGQIILGDAANPGFSTVTLLPGSLTSVSAEGALIPWGQPGGVTNWFYGYTGTADAPRGTDVTTPPSKMVGLFGTKIDVQGGAVVDDSGGGDMYGAQFVPGRSGSVDVLNGSQTFAIVPSHGRKVMPRDPQMQRADGGSFTDATPVALKVGDEVYLSGIPGLDAGYYTLLPGHYALMPGGFRVTMAKSNVAPAEVVPNQKLASGNYMVSGYRSNANTGKRDPLDSLFLVTDSTVIHKESQYDESTVGAFFAKRAVTAGLTASQLPADAGRLVIQATGQLDFEGTGKFGLGKGGRGGQADIVGTKLFIAGSETDVAPADYITLDDDSLNNIGAQSLLVGGTRTAGTNSIVISPSAQFVELAGDAKLAAPEVIVVATDTVTLGAGAVIDTTGFAPLPDAFPTDPVTGLTRGSITVNGASGALLMASNGAPVPLMRATTNPATGTLALGEGAGVFAGRSLVVNSTLTTTLDPTASLVAPTVNVAADVINLGGGTTGFTVDQAFLDTIAHGDASRGLGPTTTLILSASTAINTFGDALLGAFNEASNEYSLQNLVLSTPAIQGEGAEGNVARIAASKITLQGTSTSLAATGTGSGALEFDTNALTLGPGTLNVAGFSSTTLKAAKSVSGNGTGVLNVASDLTVVTPLITGAAKADTTLNATGAVQLTRPAGSAGGLETETTGLGAHFAASGTSVTQDTDLEFHSGVVKLSGSTVSIGDGGVIDVAGIAQSFFDVIRATPGGVVLLDALSGDVSIASTALLDLRGGDPSQVDRSKTRVDERSSDKGADAGALSIRASGTARLDGMLKGVAVGDYEGGRAQLNLGTGDATALLASLTSFTGEQSLTLATGDLNVGSVRAHKVNLSASSGNLTVTGLIDASGADGGSINLSAGHDLTIAGSAKLAAYATAADGEGGDVVLGLDGLSTGVMTLDSGSSVDVSGAKSGGRLWLRAPRAGADGVAIAPSGVTVTGARDLTVEAVAVTDVTANPFVDQALAAANAAATAYIANATTIRTNLGGLAANAAFHLLPGIELRSAGDLSLLRTPGPTNVGIDLHTFRYNDEPMVLTLRAAGNLNVNGSLSDGFGSPIAAGLDPVTNRTSGAVFALAQQLAPGSRSATLRLVAGADLAAADPMGLAALRSLEAGKGSINLNAPQLDQANYQIPSVLRTGTGDLSLAAGRDINFQSQFGVYTAGTASPPVPDFTPPGRAFLTLTTPRQPSQSVLGFFNRGNNNTPNFAPGYDTVYPIGSNASYPINGGDLNVTAQGNASSATIAQPNGNLVFGGSEPDNYWLWTQYAGATPFDQTTWFINFGAYYQAFHGGSINLPVAGAPAVAAFIGLGALGGGAANVTVGGNLSNVDVAVPTTGRIPTGPATLDRAVITGGGDLNVRVAGALDGGNLIAANGVAKIRATDIGQILPVAMVAASHMQFDVWSDRNLITMVGDLTRLSEQSYLNGPVGASFNAMREGLEGVNPNRISSATPLSAPFGYFTTFTDDTAMRLRSSGGDITLNGDYVPALMDLTAMSGSLLAGTVLNAVSDWGALTTQALVYALPAVTSQVDLLAGRDIKVGFSTNGMNPTTIDPKKAPLFTYAGTVGSFGVMLPVQNFPPSNLVQAGDTGTDHVYTPNGSIVSVGLSTSKQTEIRAGLDINKPAFYLQNNNASDVSVVEAGRDLTTCPQAPAFCGVSYDFAIQIGGPGDLVVQAGRNLLIQSDMTRQNFPPTVGITSVGNAYNSKLPTEGASLSLNVGVGAGPRNAAFIDAYLDPAIGGTVADPYAAGLIAYVREKTGQTLSLAEALTAFRGLTPEQQTPYIQRVYAAEIKAGGRAAAAGEGAGGKGYDRAYRAIQTLFPVDPAHPYVGDLTMYGFGKIRSDSGGDIGIVVPGGNVILGFENQTPNLVGQKDTAKPGVLTLRGGDINIISEANQVVAQSRVFTELGGNILMWSTNGDVDAGKGKKTSLVTSPPQFTYDPYGNLTKAPVTPQTGAGIATLVGVPGVKPGDVDLYAPHGTVDAGDAGIRVSGNVYIAAQQVANADNIQVKGKSFGLPPQAATNVALAAASTAATEASDIVKAMESREPRTTVDVEVTGFGGDDTSCADPAKRSSECPQ